MKNILRWFNNHSLRFKIISSFLLLIMITQMISGMLFTSTVERKLEENILRYNLDTLKQISASTDTILNNIVEKMIPIRDEIQSIQLTTNNSTDKMTYINNEIKYQNLYNTLISYKNNYKFINSMLVLNEDNTTHYFVLNEHINLNRDNLFDKVVNQYNFDNQLFWTESLSDEYYFNQHREDIISIIVPIKRYGNIKNLLIVNISVLKIQNYLRDQSDEDKEVLIQIDKDSYITNPNISKDIIRDNKINEILENTSRNTIENSNQYVVMTSDLMINDWKLSIIYSTSILRSNSKVLSDFIIIMIIIIGITLIGGGAFIVYEVTNPIKKLTMIMEQNSNNKSMNQRFKVLYKDEVGVLASTYNYMMDRIGELMNTIQEEQTQNRIAYLKMLQLQIKPHFLYNSLESVKFLVEMGDKKSIEMVDAIGRFYKLSLSGINDHVPLSEEIEHLTCYLTILKINYGSKYDYEIQINDDILQNDIVKFSLQPLVENAIYHGIKLKRKKGLVKIIGRKTEESVIIEVFDNGIGIKEEKLKELKAKIRNSMDISQTEHIGIINVHQRIEIQYGKPYGISIESIEGEYTRVIIKLPILQYKGAL